MSEMSGATAGTPLSSLSDLRVRQAANSKTAREFF